MSKQKVKHIHCPFNREDCVYLSNFKHPCRCILENPSERCVDFANFYKDNDNYIEDDFEIEQR